MLDPTNQTSGLGLWTARPAEAPRDRRRLLSDRACAPIAKPALRFAPGRVQQTRLTRSRLVSPPSGQPRRQLQQKTIDAVLVMFYVSAALQLMGEENNRSSSVISAGQFHE